MLTKIIMSIIIMILMDGYVNSERSYICRFKKPVGDALTYMETSSDIHLYIV